MHSHDSETKVENTQCPVIGCHDRFNSKQGARIHFRYHSKDEKREALIFAMRNLQNRLGRVPVPREMNDIGLFSVSTYQNYFSSWTNALRVAGFEPRRDRNIEKSDLIAEIHRVKNIVDKTPTSPDIVEHSKHSIRTYIEMFGTWNSALTEAGYEPSVFRNICSDDLVEEITRLHEDLGRVPSAEDMEKMGKYSSGIYWSRIGSWNRAVRLAGFEPRETMCGSWNYNYGEAWKNRREYIVQRDDNMCRICGVSRDEHDIDIDVHHIRPAREFVSEEAVEFDEMNLPSNLITLCRSCHRLYEGSWKDASPDEFVRRAQAMTGN